MPVREFSGAYLLKRKRRRRWIGTLGTCRYGGKVDEYAWHGMAVPELRMNKVL